MTTEQAAIVAATIILVLSFAGLMWHSHCLYTMLIESLQKRIALMRDLNSALQELNETRNELARVSSGARKMIDIIFEGDIDEMPDVPTQVWFDNAIVTLESEFGS